MHLFLGVTAARSFPHPSMCRIASLRALLFLLHWHRTQTHKSSKRPCREYRASGIRPTTTWLFAQMSGKGSSTRSDAYRAAARTRMSTLMDMASPSAPPIAIAL